MSNHTSVKLTAPFVEDARREALVLNRSVGAQVEFWARLGRAIESTPGFNLEHVRETMEGRLNIEVVPSGDARGPFLDALSASFDAPDATTQEYFAALGERDGAVGTDGKGGVVRRQPQLRLSQKA